MSQTVLTSGSDVAAGDSGGVVAACLGHSTVHILDVMRKQQKNDKAGGTDYGGAFLPVEQGPHIAALKKCTGLSSKARVCLLSGNEVLAASDAELSKFNAKTGSIIWSVALSETPTKLIDLSGLRSGCFLLVCHRSVACFKWHDGQQEWASKPYPWSDQKPIDDNSLFEKHCCIHDATIDTKNGRLWCAFGQHALPLALDSGAWESPGATRCMKGTQDMPEGKLQHDSMHYMMRDLVEDARDFAEQRVVALEVREETRLGKLLRQMEEADDVLGPASAATTLSTMSPRSRISVKESFIAKIMFLPADEAAPGSQGLLILTGSTRGLYAVSADTGAPVWLHLPYWRCVMAGILADEGSSFSTDTIPFSMQPVALMQLCSAVGSSGRHQRLLVTVRDNWNMYCLDADSGEEYWRTSVSAALGGGVFDDQETFECTDFEWRKRLPPPPPVALHVCVERDFVAVASSEGRIGLWRLGSGEHIMSFSTGLFSGPQLGQGSIVVQYPPGHKLALWPSAHPDPLSESELSWDTAAGKQSHEALFTWAIKHSFGDAMTKVTLLLDAEGGGGGADTVSALHAVPHLSAAPAPWSTTVHDERRVVPGALAGAGVRLAVDGFFRSKSASRDLVLAEVVEVEGGKGLLTTTTDGIMSLWSLTKGKASSASGIKAGKSALLWRRTFKHYAPFVSQYTKPEHMKLLNTVHAEGWGNAPPPPGPVAAAGSAASAAGAPPLAGSAGSVPPEQSDLERSVKFEANTYGQRLSQAVLVHGNKRLLTVAAGERHHTLRLWSVAEGELIKVFSVPSCAIHISALHCSAIPGMFGGMQDDLVSFASLCLGRNAVMLHVVRASDLATLLWMPLHPTQLRPLEVPLQFSMHMESDSSMVFTVGCKLQPRTYELAQDSPLDKQVDGGQNVLDRWGGTVEIESREQLEQCAITAASLVVSVQVPSDEWAKELQERRLPPPRRTFLEKKVDGNWAHSVRAPLPSEHFANMLLPEEQWGDGTTEHIKNRLLVMREPAQLSAQRLFSSSTPEWEAEVVAIGSLTFSFLHAVSGQCIGQLDANDVSRDLFLHDMHRPVLCFTCAAVRPSGKAHDLLYVLAPVLRDGVSSSTVLARYRVSPEEEGSDSLKVTLECSRELQGRPTKMFFSANNEIMAAVVPGTGIWLLDGRDMSLLKDHMYPFQGAVDRIAFLHSGEEDTLLNKQVNPAHRQRMLVMGSDGQLQDVPLTDFFGRMAMARVVDLGDAEEAAATGQVDMTGALFYIGLVSAILLLVLDFFQMASFALSAATPPSLDSTAESVAQFQALGLIGVDVNFKLVYWLCVGVLVFFFALFAGSEAIEGYAFRRQEDVVAQTVWIVVTSIAQVMTTVAVIPLVRVLAGAFDCIPLSDEVEGLPWNAVGGQECFQGDHLAFFFISIVLLGLYLPVVVRLLLVGNDLTRVELLLSKPWDWSQDDRNDPPREHLLSLTASRFGPAQALVKLLASIIYVLGGARFTIGSSCLVLLLGVALVVISYREPPYFNETMNHVRSALDAGVAWTYLTAVVASIVLDSGDVQSGSGSDTTLTVLPCLVLLVLPLAYMVRSCGLVEKCVGHRSDACHKQPPPVQPLQSVQVHGGKGAESAEVPAAIPAGATAPDTIAVPSKYDAISDAAHTDDASQNPMASRGGVLAAEGGASFTAAPSALATATGAPDRSELPLPFHSTHAVVRNNASLPLVAGLCHTGSASHRSSTSLPVRLRSEQLLVKQVQRTPLQWM